MIRPVGEKFEFNGVKLEVVESNCCTDCHFDRHDISCAFDKIVEVTGDCSSEREVNVIFKKVE